MLQKFSSYLSRQFFATRLLPGVPVRTLLALTSLLGPTAAMASPTPTVTLDLPAAPFIGEQFDIEVNFSNTGNPGETGYGPYVDLVLPANGADGGEPDDPDGCTFSNATYLGVAVTAQVFTFPAVDQGLGVGNLEHPYAVDAGDNPLIIGENPGDQLVVLLLPFGSFAVGQESPPVNVTAACSNLANLGAPLDITANGGFHFGADPLDNPTLPDEDASIVGPPVNQSITPTLISLTKTYIGPEDETATGPSFPRCYQVDVFVAPGQTVENLVITDELSGEIQFLQVLDAANMAGSACEGATPTTSPHTDTTPSTSTPGGTLSAALGSITADLDANSADVSLLFEFFVPKQDRGAGEVLSTDSGDDTVSPNQAYAEGNWTPIDLDDDPAPARAEIDGGGNVGDPEHTLEDQSVAIQKSVAVLRNAEGAIPACPDAEMSEGAVCPGAVLRYTLSFQVSDYFAFDYVRMTDVLSDGQRFCTNSDTSNSVVCSCPGGDCAPTLAYTEAGVALAAQAIGAGSLVVSGCFSGGSPGPTPGTNSVCDDPSLNSVSSPLGGGETVLELDLSAELAGRGSDAVLVGGCVGGDSAADCPSYSQSEFGPTSGTWVFYAMVQEAFSDNPPGEDSNDLSVDHGDVLVNDADIDGRVLDTATRLPQSCTTNLENPDGWCREADDTHEDLPLGFGNPDKLIYAINGSVASDPDAGFSDDPSDPNDGPQLMPGEVVTYQISYTLPFTDFENLSLSDYLPLPVLDAAELSFDPLAPRCSDHGNPLAAGVVCFKTAALADESRVDSFLDYVTARGYGLPGDFVTADADSNSVRFNFGSFDHTDSQATRIALLLSVSATSDPFADNLFLTNQLRVSENSTNGGDLIAYGIVQIRLREPTLTLTKGVSGTTNPAATLTPPLSTPVDSNANGVDAGDGVTYVITVENLGGAPAYDVRVTDSTPTGLTACAVVSVTDGQGAGPLLADNDLFGTGLVLSNTDPLAANDGDPVEGGAPYGADTALITVSCELEADVTPRQVITNNASVSWAARPDATSFPAVNDEASVTLAGPQIAKTVDRSAVTAGDIVTYDLAVTLPEGLTPGLTLTDRLPAGFEYVYTTVPGDGITVTPGSFSGTLTGSPSVTLNGSVNSGQTLVISFGDTTTNSNDPADNSFILSLQARVANDGANDGLPSRQTKTNDVALSWTGKTGPDVTDSASTEFGEPQLVLTKSVDPDSVDAGDSVTVTLSVQNTGTWRAYDITVTDVLNDDGDLFDLNLVSPRAGCVYANPTVTCTALGPLAAGGTLNFTFTAVVRSGVISGSRFNNTAAVSGDSQPGSVGGERNTSDSDTTSTNTLVVSASKRLIASSEAWTRDTEPLEAAIGEILTYEVRFNLPEGITQAHPSLPIIVDTLPAGMRFLDNGTASVYAVADSTISWGTFGFVSTDGGNPDPVAPTENGQALEFDFGNIQNDDRDADTERLVLTYQVLVLNTTDNHRTDTKTNSAALNYQNRSGTGQSHTETLDVSIVEPVPRVTKSAVPGTLSGGDSVTFTVTFTNQNAIDATRGWEPYLEDVLPARFQHPAITSATLNRESTSTDVTDCAEVSGQTVTVDLTPNGPGCIAASDRYLAPGENIVLIYTATVDPAVGFEETITNTAYGTSTSLSRSNGTGGVTPGAPDSDTGERTGSGNDNDSGDAVNDLVAMGSASVQANRPTITKAGGASLQVGESTTMSLTVDVPVGTTSNFIITDDLPPGLLYLGGASVGIPAGVTATTPAAPVAGSDPLVFNFGTVSNPGPGAAQIQITYDVQVRNVEGNQAGALLTNTASLSYQDASLPLPTDSETVTVVEPNLEITKTLTAGAAGSDAGDSISYQVSIQNTSNLGTAYRVELQDVLPADLLGANGGVGPFFTNIGVDNDGGAVVLNGTGTGLTAGDAQFDTTTLADDTLTWPLFDLPPRATLTISYDAVLVDNAPAGSVQTNDVSAIYHSLVDGAAVGRDGSGAGDDDGSDQSDPLDNYGESDAVDLTLDASLAVQKTLNAIHSGNNNFTIGDEVVFDLRVAMVEGVIDNLEVTDTLPAGIEFRALDAIDAGPNISHGYAGPPSQSGQDVSFDLGRVTNTADTDSSNDFLVLRLRGRVTDVLGNSDGETLTNAGSLTSDVGDAGPDTTEVNIVEPSLSVTKTPDDPSPSLGDRVTWTVAVRNQSAQATAYDVALTDTVPAGLSYVPGSTLGATVDETDPAQPVFGFAAILPLETKTFSFRTRVDEDATVGLPITNEIGVAYDGQSGTPEVERSYTGSTTEQVTPDSEAFIDAVKTVALFNDGGAPGEVDPADELQYAVILTNTGPDATHVVFTDTMPANTSYVVGSLTATAGTLDDSGAPDLVVNLGDMAQDATVTVSFRVTVDAGTPAGMVISNQGLVDSDQTVPEPTDEDGVEANGDQPTDVAVGAPPPIDQTLYVEKVAEWIVDADLSDDVSAGDTLAYVLVLSNLGDTDLTNVTLTDTIPAGLTYVAASANVSAGTIDLVGQVVNLAIPTLAANDFEVAVFEVTIDAPLVDNNGGTTDETFTNQAVANADQTGPVTSDSNGHPSDGNQPTQVTAVDGIAGTPTLDAEKRWMLAVDNDADGLVDPGDVLGYVITLRNTGSAPATNVRLSDTLSADTAPVAGSVSTSQGAVVTEDPVNVNLGTLGAGAVATVSFRVTVDGGTPDGTVIANQADTTADGGISEPSDDNGDDGDGKNPTLTPVDTDGGSGVGTPAGLSKLLHASSEADSSGANLMIGELATFRVSVQLPAGTFRQGVLVDTLPAGLSYVPGTARLARTFDTGLSTSLNPGGINAAASGDFVALADGSEFVASGQSLSLALGDVINSDNDPDAEVYTLEYQVLVTNSTSNQAGGGLDNSASLDYLNALNQPQSLTPATAMVGVIEPNVDIRKRADPGGITPLGGDLVFTVMLTNPDTGFTATAYDLNIIDNLPTEYTALSVNSITPAGGASGFTDNSAGTVLDIELDVLPPNGSLTVVYTATAPGPLSEGAITNTARAVWTSLPGDQGTGGNTPGNPGDLDGERTGAGTGPNDHADQDDALVNVGTVNLTKRVLSPQDRYAIGDIVSFQVSVALPPGMSLDSSQFSDVLDEGLTYIAGSLSLDFDSGVGATNTPAEFARTEDDPSAGFETLSLDLGTLTNVNPGVAGVTLTYQARVDNIRSNQDNQGLDNRASFAFASPGGGGSERVSDEASVSLGEPRLSLQKSVTSPIVGLDAGDLVEFEVVVGNTGTTTAYEVILADLLPSGLENVTGLSVTATTGGAETPSFTNIGNEWSTSPFDLPVGATLTMVFAAQLSDNVVPDQAIQNSVVATYTSRDGTDPDERDGSGPDSNQGDDADLNNYTERDSAPVITVANPVQIDKAFHPDPTNRTYTIGEVFTYRLTVAMIEGAVDDLVVSDTLPDGIGFQSADVGVGNPGMTTQYTPPPAQAGQTLTFDLGDLTNPSNGDTADDYITIDIDAMVENVPANVDGVVLGNHASLSYTGPGGSLTRDYDADATTPGIQPLDLTLVEPVLELTKSVDPTRVPPGDETTFTLLIDHTAASGVDAYDLEITDSLPVGLTYVPGSASVPVTVNGQQLTFQVSALTLVDDQTLISYRARVDLDAPFGQPLDNLANLGWNTRPGDNRDERAYGDADSARVIAQETTHIDALKTVAIVEDGAPQGIANPGDTLEYTVVLDNRGGPASNVVFVDAIPINTTYVPGSLTATQGAINDSNPAQMLVLVGNLMDTDSVIIRFQVSVDAFVPTGTIIRNQGLVDSDQTVPEPTDQDGEDGNGDQPTQTLVGGGDLPGNPAMYVEKLVQWLVDNEPDGAVTPGDTLRYSLVLNNTGNAPLTHISLTDPIPSGLTYVPGSAQSSAGSIDVVGQTVRLTNIASIAVGDFETAVFDVTLDNPLHDSDSVPPTETFFNQAVATSDQTGPVPSDGNGEPSDGVQRTRITAVDGTGATGEPELSIRKRVELAHDANGDGNYNPGETLRYLILLENLGSAVAPGVVVTDTLPPALSPVAGSATTSRGILVTESPMLQVNLGDLLPAEQAQISILAEIPASTQPGTVIANSAQAQDETGASVDSGPVEVTILVSRVWDPPSGIKTVSEAGVPLLTWQMVWLNSGNTTAVRVLVEDPIPTDSTYLDASLECLARGASTVDVCEFEAAGNLVRYIGDIAPDPGATGEEDAANEVVIRFRVELSSSESFNQACAHWDEDGDGFVDDDVLAGQASVCSDDPDTDDVADVTHWFADVTRGSSDARSIPALSPWGLVLLVALLMGLAWRHRRCSGRSLRSSSLG